MNRTDRLLAMTLELRSQRYTKADDLATQFEVSVRTIYRDIEALCEAGVPVVATPGYGYSLAEGYFLPPIMFTPDEAGMLLLGASFVEGQVDAPYQQAIETARKKIEKLLPESTQREVDYLQNSFRFMSRGGLRREMDEPHLALLRRGILEREVLHLTYHARHGEPGERDVEPHGLVNFDGIWMLMAYCRVRQDMRAFRLDRIDQLKPTGHRFTRRQDFTLRGEKPMDYGAEEVRVLLTEEAARWAREYRPMTFVCEEAHPEGVVMVFRPRFFRELLSWILSLGPDARVLAPPHAQDMVREAAQAITRLYTTIDDGR